MPLSSMRLIQLGLSVAWSEDRHTLSCIKAVGCGLVCGMGGSTGGGGRGRIRPLMRSHPFLPRSLRAATGSVGFT